MKALMISFSHAFHGLHTAFIEERNFRIHLLASFLASLLGLLLGLTTTEWLLLIVTMTLVLLAELFNTAIENMLDWLEPNYHESVKTVKDLSAAAVIMAAIMAVLFGCILFLPKLYSLFLS
jgi:diacylglycerol kinase